MKEKQMTNYDAWSIILDHIDGLSYEHQIFLKGYLRAMYPFGDDKNLDNPFIKELLERINNG